MIKHKIKTYPKNFFIPNPKPFRVRGDGRSNKFRDVYWGRIKIPLSDAQRRANNEDRIEVLLDQQKIRESTATRFREENDNWFASEDDLNFLNQKLSQIDRQRLSRKRR